MQQYTWFFSLEKPLSAEEEAALQSDFDRFTAQWKSHGTPVSGLIQIRYGRFVVVQADPSQARPSGCSIDSLKRGVEELLRRRDIAWLDPAWVFYRRDNGEIDKVMFNQIPALLADGEMHAETLVFDHSLAQSDDLSRWEVPMQQTWLSRYLTTKKQA